MAGERPSLASTWRFRLEWGLVGLLASIAAAIVAMAPLGNPLDRTLYDQFVRISPRTPSDRILIVAIDDASLTTLGAWPWSRARHAQLLDRLSAAGAAAVGYDVLFLEPDIQGGDAALAAALGRSGRTVLPVLQLSPGENGRPVRTQAPLPALASAAASLGQVNIAPDIDGVVRRVSARVAMDGTCWSQLALAALRVADHAGPDPACEVMAAASRKATSLIGEPPELIPFAGRPGRFRTLSASAVVQGEAPPEFIRGRIVLIGATAAGLGDRYPSASTAKGGGLTGVELQANLLDAAIGHVRRSVAPPLAILLASLIAIWGLLAALVRLRPRTCVWVLGGLLVLAPAASAIAFQFGAWASPFPAMAGMIVAYPLWSWRRLALASDALGREIERFDLEETPVARIGADALGRQLDALSSAAERLRRLHHMLAETLQSLPDATVAIDPQGVIRLANERAQQRTPGAPIVGAELGAWLEAALGRRVGPVVRLGLAEGAASISVSADDGLEFEVGVAPVEGLAAGAPWRIVRLADVTTIRRAVRQREDALQLLTHDIRAPFASISALAGEAGAGGSQLARIEAYARRGRALAESYVQWSRAENAEIASEPFDLRDALIDAADELWVVGRPSGVEVSSEVPEDEVMVVGDRSLMTRAIVNLIDNAVRFSVAGQIVEAVCVVDGHWAMCEVRDRGPGVDPGFRDRLFQRFTRAPGAVPSVGAGLGLAIAALAAERMGGKASYAPRDGGGSVFRLTAPIAIVG